MRLIPAAVCLLALSSCANLAAVSDVSTRLGTASATWNDVAREFATSCERERVLNEEIRDCKLETAASEGLVGANAVLSQYFAALGSVANESSYSIKPGLEAASKSVSAIPGINKDQVNAASGLFGLLVRLSLETAREATLRRLIGEGAPAARTIVGGLDALVATRLSRRLDAERLQASGHFARLILAEGEQVGPDPGALCIASGSARLKGTGFLLATEYCRRLAIIDKRTAALAPYTTSLQDADKALSELQSSKTRLKAQDLAKRVAQIGADLDSSIDAVRKAFG